MNDFINIIKEIAKEKEIKVTVLSKDWVIMLEKNGKTRFISGYKFDLNSQALGNVLDDKYALYEILSHKNIPIIKHNIVFAPNNLNEYAKGSNTYQTVKKYFNCNNNNIVLKANNGTCGTKVFHITKKEEINKTLDKLFSKNFSISMCPFYDIKTEYRLIILNHNCVLLYGKSRPIVVGDGNKTIKELLLKFNEIYFKDRLTDIKYSKVLQLGEIYEYGWQFNLSQGSIPMEIENLKLKEILLTMAKKITDEIDLRFGSIDIIETTSEEFLVMEINSGVMMKNYIIHNKDGYNKAKQIYREAIKELFK